MTEPITSRTTRRVVELGHDAAAVFHEQIGAAYERAADICDSFGDAKRGEHLRVRAASEHDAARRERDVAARSRSGDAPDRDDISSSSRERA